MLELSQILALVIFGVMFITIIIGKVHRVIPAVIGAGLTIILVFLAVMRSPEAVTNTLNFAQLGQFQFWFPGHEPLESRGVNWQTIIFIFGMMVMVEGLSDAGFFRWLCLFVAKKVKYRIIPIFITFMLLSGFLAMFIDSITVLLFLATVVIELARLLKFNPVPMIIAMIFAANTGGAATMSGDPPNIIIGTAFGFTFIDFLTNTGPIAWVGMIAALGFFYLLYRKTLASQQAEQDKVNSPKHPISAEPGTSHLLKGAGVPQKYPEPREAITSPTLFKISTSIFILMIILLITHAQTGLSVAIIGIIVAALTAVTHSKRVVHIMKRVDWRTLLFFFGLFIAVGGLEETGVLELLAGSIGNAAGGNALIIMTIILWVSAFASAIVDNIPFAATMVPVISNLAQIQGASLTTMSWALALGTDIGGNATPIGASANVVGTAIAEREGYKISWGTFLKPALPCMIIVVGICQVLLMVRYF